MEPTLLYYVTNRCHIGKDRWTPRKYGFKPSKDGAENLRFGLVNLPFDESVMDQYLRDNCGFGIGNGEKLAEYFYSQRKEASIEAFHEILRKDEIESEHTNQKLGSESAFKDIQKRINMGWDVLIFVHGFNVNWWEAVASGLSLQFMLNRNLGSDREASKTKPIQVVLFTWPSDGKVIPYWSYFSDRSDAEVSGYALGRCILKLRDLLIKSRRLALQRGQVPCNQAIHLLCHSMGNYVLQNALDRITKFSVGGKPSRMFDQIFLCAADVADDVLESGQPMCRLPQMVRNVTVYHNRGDLTMPVSDYTKGNTDRLGWDGADKPTDLDSRVHQVDCSKIVTGFIEHSYYHSGCVKDDIHQSIEGIPPDSELRNREPVRHGWPNIWRLVLDRK